MASTQWMITEWRCLRSLRHLLVKWLLMYLWAWTLWLLWEWTMMNTGMPWNSTRIWEPLANPSNILTNPQSNLTHPIPTILSLNSTPSPIATKRSLITMNKIAPSLLRPVLTNLLYQPHLLMRDPIITFHPSRISIRVRAIWWRTINKMSLSSRATATKAKIQITLNKESLRNRTLHSQSIQPTLPNNLHKTTGYNKSSLINPPTTPTQLQNCTSN